MPFIKSADMTRAEPPPGWKGRFFHSANMTFAIYEIDAGAVPIHEHEHPQEEVRNVVSGEIVMTIDGTEQTLGPGDAAVVPANTAHHARVVRAARAVVVDHPLRLQLPGHATTPDATPPRRLRRSESCSRIRFRGGQTVFRLRSPDLVDGGEVAAPGGPGQQAGPDVKAKQSIVRVWCRHAERFVFSDELLLEGAPRRSVFL